MSDRRRLRALAPAQLQDGPVTTLADLPDELLRNPGAFKPNGPRLDSQALLARRAAWLAERDLHVGYVDLEAERRRRWPVVDRIRRAGETKGRLGG